MIGMHQIKCENFGCSSIKSHPGRRSARSCQMRWTAFSPFLARNGMLPWITGCPLILQIKNDAGKFLDYLESTLDDEISAHVRVYELEDVKKRTDEIIDALIDCICQLAHGALIGDGSDAAIEFEVHCRLIHAIPDGDIELWKELLKVSPRHGCLTSTGDLPYILYHKVCSCCNVCWQNHQCSTEIPLTSKQPQKHPSKCWNCTCQHPPGCDNFPAQEYVCNYCLKKGHWQAKCHSSKKKPIHCSRGQTIKRYALSAWKEG